MTKNDILRKQLCSSGKCMAVWCSHNTIFGSCRWSKYSTCKEFQELERGLKPEKAKE